MNQEQLNNIEENAIHFQPFEEELIRLGGVRFADKSSENSNYYFKGFVFEVDEKFSLYAFSNLSSKYFKFVIEPTINHKRYKESLEAIVLKLNRDVSSGVPHPFGDFVLDREYKGIYKKEHLDIDKVLFQSPAGSVGVVSSVLGGGACSQLAKYNQGIATVAAVEHVLNQLKLILAYGGAK